MLARNSGSRASPIARDAEEKSPLSSMGSDDSGRLIWLDGEMVPWRDAKTHVLTHTLLFCGGKIKLREMEESINTIWLNTLVKSKNKS